MRRMAFILLGVILGWCCGSNAQALSVVPFAPVQASIDLSGTEQLRCEREYNSDFGTPQQVTAESVRTICVRTMPCPERLGVHCGVACGRSGLKVDALPEFTMPLFYAGASALDYHVYRLRRLRI